MYKISKKYYLGIDPGTSKLGLAVVNDNKEIIYKSIVRINTVLDILQWIIEEYDIEDVIVGNGSNHRRIVGMINVIRIARNNQKKRLNIHIVDERNSSLEARKIFVDKEKRFLKKMFCYIRSLFMDLDDYSAFVLVCRFISNSGYIKRQIQNL
ncbi:MAG: Holliday junction resolvase RuvX [Candidatus Calescibacterium sp.]|nr:Holliday junction resolvase RuvX [Candidatus Calescibacterium sp.]